MTTKKFYAACEEKDTVQTLVSSIENTLMRYDDFCCRNKATALNTIEDFFNVTAKEDLTPGKNSDVKESFTVYEITFNVIPKFVVTKEARQNVEITTAIEKI